MGHTARPLFKRGTEKWVALMPISLGIQTIQKSGKVAKTPSRALKVGDTFTRSDLRLHIIKSLFLRGRIGPHGHPWTENQLERKAARPAEVKTLTETEPEVQETSVEAKVDELEAPKPEAKPRARRRAKPGDA